MTATVKPATPGERSKPWWAKRRNRNKVWAGLLAVTLVAAIAVFVSLRSSEPSDGVAASSLQPSIYRFDTADKHALAFVPTNADQILFGHHGGLMRSLDGGRTFEATPSGFDAMNLVFDPAAPKTVFAAGHDVLAKSTDAGITWSPVAADLPGLDVHAFAASTEAGRYYAFAGGYGLYVSADGGTSWTLRSDSAPPGTHSIIELPDGTLVVGATDAGILRSEDGGRTWVSSRAGIDSGVIFSVKGHPSGARLYAGTSAGLFVSDDEGRTWAPTALNDAMIVSVAVNPSDGLEVMAIERGGRLYHSTDGGTTWSS